MNSISNDLDSDKDPAHMAKPKTKNAKKNLVKNFQQTTSTQP